MRGVLATTTMRPRPVCICMCSGCMRTRSGLTQLTLHRVPNIARSISRTQHRRAFTHARNAREHKCVGSSSVRSGCADGGDGDDGGGRRRLSCGRQLFALLLFNWSRRKLVRVHTNRQFVGLCVHLLCHLLYYAAAQPTVLKSHIIKHIWAHVR